MMDPLVSTEWLATRLGDAAVQVVDASWHMPTETRTGREDYEAGHIAGAVYFDIDEVADAETDLPHMLPSPEALAAAVGALGLRPDATVVVYDSQGIFSAPRVWWTLRLLGFAQVFVLDGGLKKWCAEGRPLETALPQPARTSPLAQVQGGLIRDLASVRQLVQSGVEQLVDARAAGRFTGEAPEPRAGLASGHMPGARNVPWGGLVNADGTLKSAGDLLQAFEVAGIDLAGPIVTTCGSGVSAALLALALARLGRFDVAVYDGSWTEWASQPDTPIATGAA